MAPPEIVSTEKWLEARKALLAKEKAFTRARDELSAERRGMPWVAVRKDYDFDTIQGRRSLADLFDGKGQLIVYHFMLGPEWQRPCKSCSFWADGYARLHPHLAARDVTLLTVSRAPLAKLEETKKRFGWTFPWASSLGSDFNYEFGVSFKPEDARSGNALYNYERRSFPAEEAPGISVFAKDDAGTVFHTYSTFARGLDMLNPAYHLLDLVPRGRDEAGLPHPMEWVRLRDEYGR